MRFKKIAVIGIGNVGATVAYTIANARVVQNIFLIDKNANKACGEALDIRHSLIDSNINIEVCDYENISDCEVVVICAGKARAPIHKSRSDLAGVNKSIIQEIINNLNEVNYQGVVIMVTNPVDVMTYIACKNLKSSFEKVFGVGTLLDSHRLNSVIASELNLLDDSAGCCMFGQHGNYIVPVWSLSKIQDKSSDCYLTTEMKNNFAEKVVNLGAEIVRKKGNTCYGIAYSVLKIIKTMLGVLSEPLPVSVYLNGQYGINNVCMSVLCKLGKNGVTDIVTPSLQKSELQKLNYVAQKMKNDIAEFN